MAQIFPKWWNQTPALGLVATLVGGGAGGFGLYWYASPYHTDVGYKPTQPIAYSHQLHAGDMNMVCMNCHAHVKKDSPKLEVLRDSWSTGKSVEWKRIHKLPDYAYFNHSAHMGVGVGENRAAVGCETCHGRIDQMEVVKQVQPLSMAWCIDCHSDPAPNLRPVDQLTTMGWKGDLAWQAKAQHIAGTLNPPGSLSQAQKVLPDGGVETHATASCAGCHR